MDNNAVIPDPATDDVPGTTSLSSHAAQAAAARRARLRVAVLAGMTVGAVAVTTLGDAPTTVSSIIL